MPIKFHQKPRMALFLTTDRQIDRRTLQQADTLEAAGWSVLILAMPLDKPCEEDSRVIRIAITPKKSGFLHYSLLLIYRMIRRFIPMHSYLMQFMKKIVWTRLCDQTQFYLQLFSPALSSYAPDIIIAVDLPMLPVGQIFAQHCKAKLVYDSHELYCEQIFSTQEKKLWQKLEAKHIQYCDKIITVNPSIASELRHRYHLKKVEVIYNTVPSSILTNEKNIFHRYFKLPSDRKILLYQGGLSKGRHLESMIEAMSHIKNNKVDLIILGDGQLQYALKKRVAKLNIDSRVYFHPAVPQYRLLDYTQSATAGIIPYQATCLNHYYCTPNKLFEFIAAGIPILASDLPEIKNIVQHYQIGLTGLLSTPLSLAMLIDDFFSDEARLQTWRKNILDAQQRFNWQQEEKKFLAIVEDLA